VRSEDEIRADAADEAPFSNGTEWEIWADRHCYECVNDDPNTDPEVFCPIITVSLIGKGPKSQTSWPVEWTRERVPWTDSDGVEHVYERVDTCTEFEERREDEPGEEVPPPPVPECDGQLDIIDAYLPDALTEFSREPARAEQ
jgi:hypothetical protein